MPAVEADRWKVGEMQSWLHRHATQAGTGIVVGAEARITKTAAWLRDDGVAITPGFIPGRVSVRVPVEVA